MATTILNDNIQLNAPKDLDSRKGKIVSGSQIPFATISEANSSINSAYRYLTLTIPVTSGSTYAEYWYKDGITDGDLVLKTVNSNTIDLSGYATTSSFNSFSSSINSFTSSIKNYTASINTFTSSVTRDSASFDLRITALSGSSGAFPTLNQVLLAGSASNASASFGGLFVNNLNIYKTVKNLLSGSDDLIMVAGVIRPTVNLDGYVSWSWIDNIDHTKLGFKTEVKVNPNNIQIYYNFTCSKVISMLAVTDEGGSNTGVSLGSSVGTADALIYFGYPKTNGSTIYWGGSNYTFQGAGWYGGGSSITYTTSSGNIDVNISTAGNNPNWDPYSVVASSTLEGYNVIYDVFNSNSTRLRFRMVKSDGSVLTGSNIPILSGFTYQGSGYQAIMPTDYWGGNNNWIPTFLGVPAANYWIIGIFKL